MNYDLLEIKNSILYLKNNATYGDNVGSGNKGWVYNKLLLLDGVVDLLISENEGIYTHNSCYDVAVDEGIDILLELPKNVMRSSNYRLKPDDCKKIAKAEKHLHSVLDGITPENTAHENQLDSAKACIKNHSKADEGRTTDIEITGLGMTKEDYDKVHKKLKKNKGKFKAAIKKSKGKNPGKLAALITAGLLMLGLGGATVNERCDACSDKPEAGVSETLGGDKWDIFGPDGAETTNGDELPEENPADKEEDENRGETAPVGETSEDRVVSTTPAEAETETSSGKPGKLNGSTNKNPQSNSGSQNSNNSGSQNETSTKEDPFDGLFDHEMGD